MKCSCRPVRDLGKEIEDFGVTTVTTGMLDQNSQRHCQKCLDKLQLESNNEHTQEGSRVEQQGAIVKEATTSPRDDEHGPTDDAQVLQNGNRLLNDHRGELEIFPALEAHGFCYDEKY